MKVLLSILLIIVGIGLIGTGLFLWLSIDKTRPVSRVNETSLVTTVKRAGRNVNKATRQSVRSSKTKSTTPARESERSRRSETLTGSLLVLGTLLLLVGAFYGRVAEFTLPLGAGAKLTPPVAPPPATQAKIAQTIGASPDLVGQPQKAEVVYLAALGEVQSQMQEKLDAAIASGTPIAVGELAPPDDEVIETAQQTIDKVL